MHMYRSHTTACFVLTCALVSGCTYTVDHADGAPVNGTSSSSHWSSSISSSSSANNINGVIKRSWEKKIDGVEQKMEANGRVKFSHGTPAEWAPETIIQLSELKDGSEKHAELRPNGKMLKLFVKKNGQFQPASAADEEWAAKVLSSFNVDDTADADKKKPS